MAANSECSIERFFLEKGRFFLRVLNSMWNRAGREAESIAKLLEKLGLGKHIRILDLGCGNGRISIQLALRGYRVTGIDISPIFIEEAKAKAEEYGVSGRTEFIVGDARRIDELFGEESFDAALMYWTTILGYYLDPEVDVEIMKKLYRVVKSQGYLLILNHASLDLVSLRAGLLGAPSYFTEIDESLVVVERPGFIPEKAVVRTRWIFYERDGRDLRYVSEACYELRLYSLHELVELAERAGWKYRESYRDLESLQPYRPGLSGINAVFQKLL